MTEDEFFVQLRESAEKLAHLTWELDGFSDGDDYVRLSLFGNDEKSLVIADLINDIDHAHYLNAVRPSNVLALIDRVEAAEMDSYGFRKGYEILNSALISQGERLEKAEAAVQRVRDMHSKRVAVYMNGIEEHYCAHDDSSWPCDTIRALDGGEQE